MKKRIIALLALVAMMATMLTVPVSAELVYKGDFSNIPTSGNLDDMDEWAPYSPSASTTGFNDGAAYFSTLGEMHHLKFLNLSVGKNDPGKELFMKFDIKYATNDTQIRFFLYNGQHRINELTIDGHDAGKWNTYIAQIVMEDSAVKGYVLKRGPFDTREAAAQSTAEYTPVWSQNITTKTSYIATPYLNISVKSNGKTGSAFWLDNISVYEGGFSIDENAFTLDGQNVTSLSGVTAGELAVNTVVSDATKKIDTTSKNVRNILVAFDKTGKMVGCKVENVNVVGGITEMNAKLTLDAGDAAVIADDGYIAHYIWEGLQPVSAVPMTIGAAPITNVTN